MIRCLANDGEKDKMEGEKNERTEDCLVFDDKKLYSYQEKEKKRRGRKL